MSLDHAEPYVAERTSFPRHPAFESGSVTRWSLESTSSEGMERVLLWEDDIDTWPPAGQPTVQTANAPLESVFRIFLGTGSATLCLFCESMAMR